MDDTRAWLALTLVPGVSLGSQRRLLEALTDASAIANADPFVIENTIGPAAAQALRKGPDPSLVDRTLAWLAGRDRRLVVMGSKEYPAALNQVHGAPTVLYVQGRVELLNNPSFGIVGSRNATRVGLQDAEAFAHSLADSGFTITSGLALGIDAAAHIGGLAGAASTIAVMGTGPDIYYPRRNAKLAQRIAVEGCIVTEFPVGTPSAQGNFPRRNRLISGLSRGVLVVEAALGSGSLITANYAAEQNRDVFAMPGSIHSTLSKGCHRLIKDGAKLVESADDVLSEYGIRPLNGTRQFAIDEPPGRDPILEAMAYAPMSIDEFAMHTGLGAATLAAQLTKLELDGVIEALPGGRFQRSRRREIE
jgi:DNA processing protein